MNAALKTTVTIPGSNKPAKIDHATASQITVNLEKRHMKFYALTSNEIELIDLKKSSVSNAKSICMTAAGILGTLLIELAINGGFKELHPYAKAVMTIGVPLSAVILCCYGYIWITSKGKVETFINKTLKATEVDGYKSEA